MNFNPGAPAGRTPQRGDVICTNYTAKWGDAFEVVEVEREPCGLVIVANSLRTRGLAFFSGYRMTAGGRCVGQRYRPGMAGYHAQDHRPPWNAEGFDEIGIVRPAAQPSLF